MPVDNAWVNKADERQGKDHMKVAVLYGKHDLRIEEWEKPSPGPGQVLIRVACCGICGFDLHLWEGHDVAIVKSNSCEERRLFGHEYSGTVEEIGREVTACKVGDRVTVTPYAACGKCFFCRNGIENFCNAKTLSTGAWAEYTVTPEASVYPLPNEMSFETAALVEPLSCCVHAMDRAMMKCGSSVCIIGGGPIGLILVALSKAGGVSYIIVSEPEQLRRNLAVKLGANCVVDPLKEDLLKVVRAKTRGWGVDYSFEAVGKGVTTRQAMDVVRNAGTVMILGVANREETISVRPFEVYARELTVMGSFSRSYAYDRTIRHLAGLDLRSIITHTFKLDEIVKAMTYAKEGKGGKILVRP
jgi:threonine dehydrogenase-like Zn-dependent dehydrogenase